VIRVVDDSFFGEPAHATLLDFDDSCGPTHESTHMTRVMSHLWRKRIIAKKPQILPIESNLFN